MSIRIVVTGRHGQVARALTEAGAQLNVEIVPLGRSQLDLGVPESIGFALTAAAPDIIVNAAAYTAVDQAEQEPERADAINATNSLDQAKIIAYLHSGVTVQSVQGPAKFDEPEL